MDTDTKSFLLEQGHGVLAFNTSEPYAVPVSYGFDPDRERCHLQLFFGEESKKRLHIDKNNGVCLVVYRWNSVVDWRSVVMIGQLREMQKEEYAESAEIYNRSASIPDMSVFTDSINDLEIGWFELMINSINERHPTGEIF